MVGRMGPKGKVRVGERVQVREREVDSGVRGASSGDGNRGVIAMRG